MNSTYEKLGGMSAIKTLANEFYDVMEADPFAKELRDLHPKILNSARNNLHRFLTHWFGGPKIFNDKYINGEWLELRHRHIDLSDRFAQQWIYCMETALTNLNYDKEVKSNVLAKLQDMIKNMKAVRGILD